MVASAMAKGGEWAAWMGGSAMYKRGLAAAAETAAPGEVDAAQAARAAGPPGFEGGIKI